MKLRRREFIGTAVAGGVCAFGGSKLRSLKKKMNILYIMTDQQPVSCVSAYGKSGIKTPGLDSLAKDSALFERAYISAFPCSPSRACQLTGREMHNTGVVANDAMLHKNILTLGDIAKDAGYTTGYFGKSHLYGYMYRGIQDRNGYTEWHFDATETPEGWEKVTVEGGMGEDAPQHGFDLWRGGWEHYKNWLRAHGMEDIVSSNERLGCHMILPPGDYSTVGVSAMPEEFHVESFISNETSRFIEQQKDTDRPWCAVCSFYGPHPPVAPPAPWDTAYSADEVELPESYKDSLEGKPAVQRNDTYHYRYGQWTDEEFKKYISLYWGLVSFIDQQIGEVISTLKQTGQYDNTMIVFTSDHGNFLGEHGMIFKSFGNGYEELYNVPMLIRVPGKIEGGRQNALVSHVDVLPTILDACGIIPPPGIDGKSLILLSSGQTTRHRNEVFCQAETSSIICRTESHKFVLHWGVENEINELYDLRCDPNEMRNIAYEADSERTVSAIKEKIFTWLKETGHPYWSVIRAKDLGKTAPSST